MPNASYLLPIRMQSDEGITELAAYLRSLDGVEIVVIDGSASPLFAALDRAIADVATHVRVDPHSRGSNGKACAVLAGLAVARCDKIIVADDDVRYDATTLREVLKRLDRADVVRPQNYFQPAPWHAALDGARSLINRALDGDWPGTLAFWRQEIGRAHV